MTRASDHAYQSIRSLILSGAYQPGQRMTEEELAHRVGVSRTSVRDSLRRLASDGLVRSEPSRGTFVAEMSMAEIEEIFQLRATLEGHASALAALHAKPEDIEELAHISAHIEDLLQANLDNDALFAQFQASNNQFHGVMQRASGSVRLYALAKPLIELPLVQMKNHNWPGEVSVRRSNQQHLEIIEALVKRGGGNIIGIDLVEVAPAYDPAGVTAILAAELLLNSLGFIFHARSLRKAAGQAHG
jgi:DNA-binding GntR family transcriptional regulator